MADRDVKQVRIGLALLALPTVLTGVWATLAPRSWYTDYGGGAAPPSAFGAYNEHFVQDLGGGFLAVGAILIFALIWPRRDAVRVALLGFVVHTIPHFVVHLIEDGDLTKGGYYGINATLLFGLLLALRVWRVNERVAQVA
jgi:hypothetical protein